MKQKNFIQSMFSDESGEISSKRILGTICILGLLFVLICNCFKPTLKVDPNIIDSVTYISIALVFATSSDKAMKYFNQRINKTTKDKEDGDGH